MKNKIAALLITTAPIFMVMGAYNLGIQYERSSMFGIIINIALLLWFSILTNISFKNNGGNK